MTPYDFRYKINNYSIAQLCERHIINEAKLAQIERALNLYLSNKSYKKLYEMSCKGHEDFPICYAGDPDFCKKEDLLQFCLDMIHGEYDIPEGYVQAEVNAMSVEELKNNEKISNLIY